MINMRVPLLWLSKKFNRPEPLLKKIGSVAKTGQFVLGPWVEEFEKKFARYCGTKYAIGVNSGTDAIFLILKALGIGVGDEVITVPNSFIATASAVEMTGARPVFVDVGDDFNINPTRIERAITSRTKAILPVHLCGNPAQMERIALIAKKHGLYVVEDAAQAVGAELNGKKVGSFGIASAFSLHPLKNLNVWGDGGVITTDSKKIKEKIMLLRNHGKDGKVCKVFGYNSRLDSVHAAVAMHLLKGLRLVIQKRRKNAAYYDHELSSSFSFVKIPQKAKNVKHTFSFYFIRAKRRDQLKKYLLQKGIETEIHYVTPIHLTPAGKHLNYKKGSFPVAERLANEILTLPVHEYLAKKDLRYIVYHIKKFYEVF